jgi:CubicO group peptidase (beta-lactamase class C family)
MDPHAPIPDAAASDPLRIGWMQGSPPPADKTILFEDGSFLRFPQSRWSYSHMRQFGPTVEVPRGPGPVAALPRAEIPGLDQLPVTLRDGRRTTWLEALALAYTDGIVVLHRGTIVYERYFGAGAEHRPHIAFSVTKSFVGTLAAMLVDERLLDPEAPVTHYVPELGRSAYGDATVRQVMDMTVSVDCSEDYTDPNAGIFDLLRAAGAIPHPAGTPGPRTLCGYMITVQKLGSHGAAFAYRTVNTEVLAWILRRISGT